MTSKSLLKLGEILKGSMKKILGLLLGLTLLTGCAESLALLGPSLPQ